MNVPHARFYDELADWWPLFSPPEHYADEAADLLERLGPRRADAHPTLLELGSGGGSLASHLRPYFTLTLTNRAPGMLAVSRAVNPDAEHILGDMRTLRLRCEFDVVLNDGSHTASPAVRFARWRTLTRICLVAGVALCLAAPVPPLSPRSFPGALALASGVALLAATFVLYFRYCNRCPRCGVSFSNAPEYQNDEMSGLPLLNRIEKCPFCSEPLRAD